MGYRLCEKCRKRDYPNFDKAIHAALASSRGFKKPFRTYACPHKNPNADKAGSWHTTSKEERKAG